MKSSELTKLDGFCLSVGYSLELFHKLAGYFPAIIAAKDKPFVCLSKEAIEKVIALLPKRRFKINKGLYLSNEKEKIAFHYESLCLLWKINRESESMLLLDQSDIAGMKPGDLQWAFGLVSDDMSEKEFRKTIEFALSQMNEFF
jgi:hypothetical protein